MTPIRIANTLFFIGLALQAYGIYTLCGWQTLIIVLGSECMALGLIGVLRAR